MKTKKQVKTNERKAGINQNKKVYRDDKFFNELRIELVFPGLLEVISKVSTDVQRSIAYNVAKLAIEHAGLKGDFVDEAVANMELGNTNEALQSKVKVYVERLDNEAYALEAKRQENNPYEKRYLTAFRKARAANALYYALDNDELRAATESIYEASKSVDNSLLVKEKVEAILEKRFSDDVTREKD
ncbi:hypothetical protein IPM62_01230 [Candidatus Woesebacteria bacterium]|nr:MAG: hypothetical protein IPM62_01230 [Candidatus Woesebacteria bacterium]